MRREGLHAFIKVFYGKSVRVRQAQPNPKSVLRCNPVIELRGHIAARDAAAAVTLDGHVAARDAVKVTKELRQRRKGDLLPD